MPKILVTNDDGIHAPGLAALADAVRPLGDVLVVAPHQESSAIGHALTLRRPLRLETARPGPLRRGRHADRLREHRRGGAARRAAAGPRGVGHQHRLEPRRRRDLFGHGVRGARGGAARRAGDRRVVDAHARLDVRLRALGGDRARRRRPRARAGSARPHVPQRQRPEGAAQGRARDGARAAQPRDDDRAARRPPRTAVLLDRGRGERLAPARSQRLPDVPRRLRLDHAAAARHDRACRARPRPRAAGRASAEARRAGARRGAAKPAIRVRARR